MDTLWMVSSQPVMVAGDPYIGMKRWQFAVRSIALRDALRPIDLERCATASELRVMLAVRGLVTATQGRAKEARLRWRRWVKSPQAAPKTSNDPIAETSEVERRKRWHERAKVLRRDARVARKLAYQAQRTLRAYTCAFWLARREDPRMRLRPRPVHPDLVPYEKPQEVPKIVREAWGEP